MLSKTVFLVDQWKAAGTEEAVPMGKPILVIAPYLSAALEHRQYFLLRGQVVKFDPAAIGAAASGYALDLPPDMQARYLGQPVLVATSVVNSTSVELGRKPLMPEEIAMTAAMKTIAPAFAALRAAADAAKAADVSQNTARLVPAFTQTEAIWDGLGQSPAAQWARDARAHAAAIDRAAAAGNWDAVKASAAELNQVCANCHGAYRGADRRRHLPVQGRDILTDAWSCSRSASVNSQSSRRFWASSASVHTARISPERLWPGTRSSRWPISCAIARPRRSLTPSPARRATRSTRS